MQGEKNQFNPYFASINYDPAQDTEQDRLEFSRKFIALPKVVKYGFLDKDIETAIRDISKKYNINDLQNTGEVSRMVRSFFLDGEDERDWEDPVRNKLKIDKQKTQEFLADVRSVVEKVKMIGANILVESVEKLPIIPALKKYENLGDQDITENQIEIEIGDGKEFVNPNIKNWLEDYIQNKGAQAHNNLERSDYLYKSKNTEELSTQERNKLSILLASYDKDDLLAIEKQQQEIFFDDTLDVISKLSEQKNAVNVKNDAGDGRNGFGSIQLASTSSDTKKEEEPDQINQAQGGVSRKSHEINWYGTNPFDGLEKIDKKPQSQQAQSQQASQLVKMGTNKNDQPTKHVIDLKNS